MTDFIGEGFAKTNPSLAERLFGMCFELPAAGSCNLALPGYWISENDCANLTPGARNYSGSHSCSDELSGRIPGTCSIALQSSPWPGEVPPHTYGTPC